MKNNRGKKLSCYCPFNNLFILTQQWLQHFKYMVFIEGRVSLLDPLMRIYCSFQISRTWKQGPIIFVHIPPPPPGQALPPPIVGAPSSIFIYIKLYIIYYILYYIQYYIYYFIYNIIYIICIYRSFRPRPRHDVEPPSLLLVDWEQLLAARQHQFI